MYYFWKTKQNKPKQNKNHTCFLHAPQDERCKSESVWEQIFCSWVLVNYRVSFHVKLGQPFSRIFKGMETPDFEPSLEESISTQTSVFSHFERLSLPNLVSWLGYGDSEIQFRHFDSVNAEDWATEMKCMVPRVCEGEDIGISCSSHCCGRK